MKLQLVVPCFNEQDTLPNTITCLVDYLDGLVRDEIVSPDSGITFVDDGSDDNTWSIIEGASSAGASVSGIKLSRNHGHQNALLAGLLTVDGDVVVSLDADLQDDVHVIREMVESVACGYDIVYGVRGDRSSDSFFKRTTANIFYRMLSALGAQSIPGHADFRLMTRCAIEGLRLFPEVNLFLRGLMPLIGFKSRIVEYRRLPRLKGETKYPLTKMLGLALEAVTSFSTVPLQLIGLIGLIIFFGALAVSGWALWVKLFSDQAVPGWASTVLPIYFLGGVQLLGIGVLGVYLGKVYQEVKRRPRYIVERVTWREGAAGIAGGDVRPMRHKMPSEV